MERLTKRITENQIELSAKANKPQHYSPIIHIKHPFWTAFDKLAEYEQAEEDGLLIRLPFRIGQKVYYIYASCIDGSLMIGGMVYGYSCLDFPRTYYATKAEAEQALAKMKGV